MLKLLPSATRCYVYVTPYEAWITKYSAAGVLLWKRQRSKAIAYGAATDHNGNVYIAGETSFRSDQETYARIAKYSSAGVPLWERQLETPKDRAQGIATDRTGNVYMTEDYEVGYRDRDAWIAKYSAAGTLLWKRKLATRDDEGSRGVATDRNGNVYMAGSTSGSLGGPNRGFYDALITKYSAAGVLLWARQLGTADDDGANGIATDISGNIYITGSTSQHFSGTNQENYGWIAKYSAAGALLWQRRLSSNAFAEGVATDRGGDIYSVGSTKGSHGDNDAWIANYSAAAVRLWERQLGTNTSDAANGISADRNGNVYMAGYTFGSLGGPNQGDSDGWIAKYYQRQ